MSKELQTAIDLLDARIRSEVIATHKPLIAHAVNANALLSELEPLESAVERLQQHLSAVSGQLSLHYQQLEVFLH